METFSALLALCTGNSPLTGEFSSQRPVTRSFGVFFDLRLNKRLSKHSKNAGDMRHHPAHYDATVIKYKRINYMAKGRDSSYYCTPWRIWLIEA